MEQNREPVNKPIFQWSINFWQRSQEYTVGKGWFFFPVNGMGKTAQPHAKNETGPLSYAIHKKENGLTTWMDDVKP